MKAERDSYISGFKRKYCQPDSPTVENRSFALAAYREEFIVTQRDALVSDLEHRLSKEYDRKMRKIEKTFVGKNYPFSARADQVLVAHIKYKKRFLTRYITKKLIVRAAKYDRILSNNDKLAINTAGSPVREINYIIIDDDSNDDDNNVADNCDCDDCNSYYEDHSGDYMGYRYTGVYNSHTNDYTGDYTCDYIGDVVNDF